MCIGLTDDMIGVVETGGGCAPWANSLSPMQAGCLQANDQVMTREIGGIRMERAETILRFMLQAIGLALGVAAAVLSALGGIQFETIGLFAGVGCSR